MKYLLLTGAKNTGKSSIIYRLTQKLELEGYTVTAAGKFPKSLKDFQCVLTKGTQKILIHSYADNGSLTEFSNFYNQNREVDLVILPTEQAGPSRTKIFELLALSEADENVIEIPLNQVIEQTADDTYINNYLDKMKRLAYALIDGWFN